MSLKGEAFFNVTKNPLKPFIVKTESMDITVLGTSFNVRCYNNEKITNVALEIGKVLVETSDSKDNKYILFPGEGISVNNKLGKVSRYEVDPKSAFQWKEGLLYFNKADFDEVINELSRWYGVEFIIENYNQSKPFSNFFPGIAGIWGVPMWVFYVNRGQCIASFGIESKDKAIMEFQPANKAYRQTALNGFRTFVKVKTDKKEIFWEPFQTNLAGSDYNKNQKMSITAHDLTLEEVNKNLGLVATVNYYTLPNEPYAALFRKVTIKNISKKNVSI